MQGGELVRFTTILPRTLKKIWKCLLRLGTTTSVGENDVAMVKGDIADVKMWKRALSKDEVENISKNPTEDGLVFHMDFENGEAKDKIGDADGEIFDCEYLKEDILVPHSLLYHIEYSECSMEAEDEGLVKVGDTMKWKKGNHQRERKRRYIKQMQTGEWDYKSDGMNSLKYELVEIEEISTKSKDDKCKIMSKILIAYDLMDLMGIFHTLMIKIQSLLS